MTDPIAGRCGALVASGWIAAAPTGQDEAYLMLTTPDPAAGQTMPLVAAQLGMRPGQVMETTAVTVQIGRDGWAGLVVAGDRVAERPVSAEWAALACQRRRVVLVIGCAPHPAGMDVDAYTDRYGVTAAIGLVPCSAQRS